MKAQLYGIRVDGQLIIQKLHLHEDTAFKEAHQIHYERFYKSNVQLVKCDVKYEVLKQISQQPPAKIKTLKKRKKLRKRLKV